MKSRALVISLIFAVCGCSERPANTSRYRHSADFSEQILYMGPELAITKSLVRSDSGETETYFAIVKAHWIGAPELACFTGDTVDEYLVKKPVKLCKSFDGGWIIAQIREVDTNVPGSFAAVSLTNLTVYKGRTLADISRGTPGAPAFDNLSLIPVEAFFDKEVITSVSQRR